MFRILIDTSVWLDLAKEGHQQPLLAALEDLIRAGEIELIVPSTVAVEFARNKARVIEDGKKSIIATVKRARAVIRQFAPAKGQTSVLRALDEVDQRAASLPDAAGTSVKRIEKLLAGAQQIPISENLTLRAARRALARQAPFHSGKNSIDDAVIFETYVDLVSAKASGRTRFMFVSHNTKDFSDPIGDKRRPHPDLAPHFSRIRSTYFIALADALRRVSPDHLADAIFEHEWTEELRSLGEISAAIEEMIEKIWYDRHSMRASQIEKGKIKIIPRAEWSSGKHSGTIVDDIWMGALKAAKKVERRYGRDNLGPWTNFEWGMLNGKLSALRWVLGDEWDMLDT